MKKVILFGASGHLGKAIAKELISQDYHVTAVVRSRDKAREISSITDNYIIADPLQQQTIQDICKGQEVVISALGKSVSINDHSMPGFEEVDLQGNLNILEDAVRNGVSKFIYISAFHAEKFPQLTYFRVHHEFAERLKSSGLDYSVIKPPALFSAFLDMMPMAAKGMLVNMGKADKKTNPIYEGDLAKIVVASIAQLNSEIEAGGKIIYTRKELNDIVQQQVNPGRRVRTMPFGLFTTTMPLIRLFSKNMYDKMAFILEVFKEDTIAPQRGEKTFEDYMMEKAGRKKPAPGEAVI